MLMTVNGLPHKKSVSVCGRLLWAKKSTKKGNPKPRKNVKSRRVRQERQKWKNQKNKLLLLFDIYIYIGFAFHFNDTVIL